MNRAKPTFPRRGHLFTALAAAVLLAACSGTAAAQDAGVTITGPSNNTVNEGGTATYTVVVKGYAAAGADAGTVAVELAAPSPDDQPPETGGEPGDVNQNLGSGVNFQVPANSGTEARMFSESKTISVTTNHDNDAEDEHFSLAFALSSDGGLDTTAAGGTDIALPPAGMSGNPNALIISDDEKPQGYVLTKVTGTPQEGAAFTVNLTASPAHEDGSGTLQVNIGKTSGWELEVAGEEPATANTDASENATVVSANSPTRAITIKQTADGNRTTDTVTVEAWMGAAGRAERMASISIDVADINALPAVAAMVVDKDGKKIDPQPASVKEGETIKIAVMPVDKDGKQTTADEALDIALASSGTADARDYRVGGSIKVASGQNMSNAVDLIIGGDDDDVGMETLTLDATVSGEEANGTETKMVAGVLTIDIEDTTAKKVSPKSDEDLKKAVDAAIMTGGGDEGLNPGESFTLMASDLFNPPMEGYSMSIGASVMGDAVSASTSGSGVDVTAVKAGDATITVTATANEASSSATGSQDVSNVAHVEIPVMVTDKMLTLTLEAPTAMDGAVVEGMDYDITATANRAVMEDTEVMFIRGDMSEADVRDYSIDDVTIMAGEMTATATLMVTEDMMDDSGEALHLYGMAGETMSNTLELTLWDEAVPALPLVAQLLLALFLTAGGARLYRRRRG